MPARAFFVPGSRFQRSLVAVALAGLITHAAYALGGIESLDALAGDWIYNGLILMAALACLARGLSVSVERLAWLVMAAGLLCWSAAEIYKSVTGSRDDTGLSVADPLYLVFYPAAYVALILLVRERMERLPTGVWLDGVIAALATAAMGAAVLDRSITDATDADGVAVAVNLAYPLGDIILLGAIVGVIALTGWRPGPAWVLLAASLAVGAVADAIFLEQVARDTYSSGTVLDTLWPLSVLLVGLAAWSPAQPRRPLRLEGWRLVVAPCVFALLAVGIMADSLVQDPSRTAVGLAAACLVATIGRMALAHLDTLRAVGGLRQASLTDSLTGLLNRRALVQRLGEPRSEPLLVAILDLNGFKDFNDRFGHVQGDELLERLALRLSDAVGAERVFRLGGDEFCVVVPNTRGGADSPMPQAAVAALTTEHRGLAVSASIGTTIASPGDDDVSAILHRADQEMYAQKQTRRMATAFSGLLDAIYARRPELRERTAEVARIAHATGTALGMNEGELRRIARAVELRDLGLVAVADDDLSDHGRILDDPRTSAEYLDTAAAMIAGATPELEDVARIVQGCGSGHEDAPDESRVIIAADAFLRTMERGAASSRDALERLRAGCGPAIDARIVAALEQAVSSGERAGVMLRRPTPGHNASTPGARCRALTHAPWGDPPRRVFRS